MSLKISLRSMTKIIGVKFKNVYVFKYTIHKIQERMMKERHGLLFYLRKLLIRKAFRENQIVLRINPNPNKVRELYPKPRQTERENCSSDKDLEDGQIRNDD